MSVEIVYNTTAASPILYSFGEALGSATAYGHVWHSYNDSWAGPRWEGPWNSRPLQLYRNGCINGDGIWNCTKACQEVDQVFSSAFTLQNCMVFPQISSLLLNDSLTEAARDTARDAGINQSDYNISNTIHDVITGCYKGYCNQHPHCVIGTDQDRSCYVDVYG